MTYNLNLQSSENITVTRSLAGGRSTKDNGKSYRHIQAMPIFFRVVRKVLLPVFYDNFSELWKFVVVVTFVRLEADSSNK